MKLLPIAMLAILPASFIACTEAAPSKAAEPAKRHPLKGVVTGVLAEKSSILVKHEAIPGVMRAMTMMFRVDEPTLKGAKEGQAIAGMLSRQGDEWWLHDVKVVPGK